MEKVLAKFDGYFLREVSFDRDVIQLSDWISADEHHRNIIRPAFFLGLLEDDKGYITRPDPRPTCYALEDVDGAVMYIRIDRAARVNIQFPPSDPRYIMARGRVAKALAKGMLFLEVGLQRAHVSEWVFDTRSEDLRLLSEMRLGFVESPQDLVRAIPLLPLEKRQEEPPEAQETPPKEVM